MTKYATSDTPASPARCSRLRSRNREGPVVGMADHRSLTAHAAVLGDQVEDLPSSPYAPPHGPADLALPDAPAIRNRDLAHPELAPRRFDLHLDRPAEVAV